MNDARPGMSRTDVPVPTLVAAARIFSIVLMPTLADILGGASLTTLTVHIPGKSEVQTYLVQHGMTIGRDPSNAIVIDHCDLCAVHAGICRADDSSEALFIECLQDDFRLTNAQGNDIDGWPLNHGLVFWIGAVRFTCAHIVLGEQLRKPEPIAEARARVPEPEPEYTANETVQFARRADETFTPVLPVLRVACPRCHDSLQHLPTAAKFCPRCGLELPAHCPPWTADGELNLANPALAAYAHALFNLGARYEVTTHAADLAQAIRYYEKAAKIGVPAAKARLELREMS